VALCAGLVFRAGPPSNVWARVFWWQFLLHPAEGCALLSPRHTCSENAYAPRRYTAWETAARRRSTHTRVCLRTCTFTPRRSTACCASRRHYPSVLGAREPALLCAARALARRPAVAQRLSRRLRHRFLTTCMPHHGVAAFIRYSSAERTRATRLASGRGRREGGTERGTGGEHWASSLPFFCAEPLCLVLLIMPCSTTYIPLHYCLCPSTEAGRRLCTCTFILPAAFAPPSFYRGVAARAEADRFSGRTYGIFRGAYSAGCMQR